MGHRMAASPYTGRAGLAHHARAAIAAGTQPHTVASARRKAQGSAHPVALVRAEDVRQLTPSHIGCSQGEQVAAVSEA